MFPKAFQIRKTLPVDPKGVRNSLILKKSLKDPLNDLEMLQGSGVGVSSRTSLNSGRPPLLSSLCLCLFLVQPGGRTAAVPIGGPSTSLTKALLLLLVASQPGGRTAAVPIGVPLNLPENLVACLLLASQGGGRQQFL